MPSNSIAKPGKFAGGPDVILLYGVLVIRPVCNWICEQPALFVPVIAFLMFQEDVNQYWIDRDVVSCTPSSHHHLFRGS